MPYCPNCKNEYREGFDTCSDCGASLIPTITGETVGETQIEKPRSNKAFQISFAVVILLVIVTTVGVFGSEYNSLKSKVAQLDNDNMLLRRENNTVAALKEENNKLTQENAKLSKEANNIKGGTGTMQTTSIPRMVTPLPPESPGEQNIIRIQSFEYKYFNYGGYNYRGAQLKILINNTTDGLFDVNPINFKAITDKNRTIPKSTELEVGYEYENKEKVGFDGVDLSPNTQTDGMIFFELREGEKIKSLIYDGVKAHIEIPIHN